jgi:hypothetical protein
MVKNGGMMVAEILNFPRSSREKVGFPEGNDDT